MAWLELHLQLVCNRFEAVTLILLVPHTLVWFDFVGLLAMKLLAVGAIVLLPRLVLLRRLLLILLLIFLLLLLITSTSRFGPACILR